MNQTNIDYLFQVIAPAADRATSASRGGEGDAPGFDDHLSQASASAFDVASPPKRSSLDLRSPTEDNRSDSPNHEPSQNTSSTTACDSASSCEDDTSSTISSSTDVSQPIEEASETEHSFDEVEKDDRDNEQVADDALAAAGAEPQVVGANPAVRLAAETHDAEVIAAQQTKGEIDAVETDKPKETGGATSNDSAPIIDAQTNDAIGQFTISADVESVALESADDASGLAPSNDGSKVQAAPSKDATPGVHADASNAAAAADEAAQELSPQEIDRGE